MEIDGQRAEVRLKFSEDLPMWSNWRVRRNPHIIEEDFEYLMTYGASYWGAPASGS
jgi:hypothetical protein